MRLLLTNDDGIDAEGLGVLRAAAGGLGQTTVVAPREGRSGGGHSVTYQGEIRVREVSDARLGLAYACDGSPADCVRLALTAMDLGPFDWVLAGVNRGANLGVDVLYSGTVAAVREGALLGRPGIAVSQYVRRGVELDWERVERQVRHLLSQLLEESGSGPIMWNVNLPAGGEHPPGLQVTAMGYDPLPMEYERIEPDSEGAVGYRYCGSYADRKARPGTDVAVTLGGDVSLTPLNLNGTDAGALDRKFAPPGV